MSQSHNTKQSDFARECLFINRAGTALFLISLELFIAGALSEMVWGRIFNATFPTNAVPSDAELLGLKPLLNLVMYAMPFAFNFMAIGTLAVGMLAHLLGFAGTQWEKKKEKARVQA